MYGLFEKIMLIYSLITSLCIMIFPFTIEKENLTFVEGDKETDSGINEDIEKKVVRNVILLITVVICVLGIVWLIWHREYSWILLPITLLTFFERIDEAFNSIAVVQKTLNSKGDELLSVKEQVSMMSIALLVNILNMFDLPIKCLQIANNLRNEVISDIMLVGLLVVFITVYYFLTGAMLLIPIRVLARIKRRLTKGLFEQQIVKRIEKCKAWHQQVENYEYVSIRLLEWQDEGKLTWINIMPIFIFAMVIDVFCKLLIAFLRSMLMICLHLINEVIRVIKMIEHFMCWIIKISDRRMLILIFRSALIFSLTSIVIINRYTPIVKKYQEGTAVLEFLASAIVIPLVLTWIMEYKKQE